MAVYFINTYINARQYKFIYTGIIIVGNFFWRGVQYSLNSMLYVETSKLTGFMEVKKSFNLTIST